MVLDRYPCSLLHFTIMQSEFWTIQFTAAQRDGQDF